MITWNPDTEAGKPRPFEAHMRRAVDAWSRIKAAVREHGEDHEDRVEKLEKLREAARRGFWLYPLVEAKYGRPW